MKGIVSGTNITNITIKAGTDVGNAVGDIVEAAPTAAWANDVVAWGTAQHTQLGAHTGVTTDTLTATGIVNASTQGNLQDGSIALQTMRSENTFDYIASGCVITADSVGVNKNYSMTAGVVYIGGKRVVVNAVSAQTVGASKDRYIDVDNTGTLLNTEVANNAASPALAANSIRLGIVVAGATTIATAASINQGQEDRVLPIASSVPYAVTDSLGNLICPRDPNRKVLGYRQITGNLAALAATSATALTGLSVTFLPVAGRKYVVKTGGSDWLAAAALFLDQYVYDTNTAGTVLAHNAFTSTAANGTAPLVNESGTITAASASAKTVIAAYAVSTSSVTLRAATSTAWIKVELV